MHDPINAFGAIVYEHEAAGLMTVAPDVDGEFATINGFNHFPADGSRSFLAASVPGSPRTINVMKPRNGCFQTTLSPVFLAKNFRDELLPAVSALSHGRVSIGFFQSADLGILLKRRVVHAGG